MAPFVSQGGGQERKQGAVAPARQLNLRFIDPYGAILAGVIDAQNAADRRVLDRPGFRRCSYLDARATFSRVFSSLAKPAVMQAMIAWASSLGPAAISLAWPLAFLPPRALARTAS